MSDKSTNQSGKFLIWSIEHSAWWAPNHRGYTPSWSMAGRYSKEEAYTISCRANIRSLNEVPVPLDFIDMLESFNKKFSDGIKEVFKS